MPEQTEPRPQWAARQSNADEAEQLRAGCANCGHAMAAHGRPHWPDQRCYISEDCRCEQFRPRVDTAVAFIAEAQDLLDQRELAQDLARQAAILCAAEATNQRVQALALASMALSMAYGSDRP